MRLKHEVGSLRL